MKTKIWMMLMACTLLPSLASAQADARLDSLERLFEASGMKINRGQSHHGYRGTTYSLRASQVWHCDTLPNSVMEYSRPFHLFIPKKDRNGQPMAQGDMREVVQRSRHTFDELMATAAESYHFEKHTDTEDTLQYSIALSSMEGDSIASRPYGIRKIAFQNVAETATLRFTKKHDNWGGFKVLEYYHEYKTMEPDVQEWGIPLDVKAYEAQLAKVLKHRHVKRRPVHWKHDPSCPPNAMKDYIQRQTYPHNEGYGETTGTCYFVPASEETLAYELLSKVYRLTKEYVDAHPSNDYVFSISQKFDNSMNFILSCQLNFYGKNESKHALDYALYAYKDKAGFYFLSIVTDGDLWMPRDWPRLKSWVNGVRKEW